MRGSGSWPTSYRASSACRTAIDKPLTPPVGREPLEALAKWRPRFEDPAFSIGDWEPSRTGEDGVIHMGWFEYSPEALEFHSDIGQHGWIQPFDWGTWARSPDGERILREDAGIESATAEDLVRVLTAVIRSDRFNEGSFAGAFESGLLTRVARRAEVLAKQLRVDIEAD